MKCFKQYSEKAKRTVNPLLTDKEKVTNAVMGIAGESGEITDYFKKVFFQKHDYNKDVVIDELGDVFWYISMLVDTLDIDISDVLNKNIEKLEKRYPNGFSSQDSKNRKQ